MNECFKCGASGEITRLFDAISVEGVVKICQKCLLEEHLPLIKKPTTLQINQAEKKQGFKEDVAKHYVVKRNDLRDKENVSLRNIVDMNLKIPRREELKPRPDLIENFHWKILRVRRMKHLSREQFARDLGESETLIKMVEQGVLPEDDNKIINKIEGYLGINLRKPEFRKSEPERQLGFDSVSVKNLTISDLKEMRKERKNGFLQSGEIWEGEDDLEEKDSEEKDLSEEEIDDILFGRKR